MDRSTRSANPETGQQAVHTATRDVLLFGLVAAIFVALRARWIGHLLVWDEAMNLLAVRAFTAGLEDSFSNWFFRHPPLYCLVMSLLSPFKTGFAERVELLNIGIGVVNLSVLYLLNRRVLGRLPAFLSILFLAVMPGAVFFDLWIKRDPLATTFGLLAILAYAHDRRGLTGLLAGLALLCKETAIFYCIAIGLLWLLRGDYRTRRGWLTIVVLPVVTAGWWYLALSTDSHVTFMSGEGGLMRRPAWYYLARLFHDCGSVGAVLTAIGVVLLTALLVLRLLKPGESRRPNGGIARYWALFVLAPALVILSSLPSKVPWILIVLYPAAATVCAQTVGLAWTAIPATLPRALRASLVALVTTAILIAGRPAGTYEDVLRKTDADQHRGAVRSKQVAESVNRHITDEDRLLLTSFHYWKGIQPGFPCPVFTYYLQPKPAVLRVSHLLDHTAYAELIRQYGLTWALLSPEPEAAGAIFGAFDRTYHCRAIPSEGAYLFETRGMLTE